MKQSTFFDNQRSTLAEAIETTVASLKARQAKHPKWSIAWSGGKDSTALVTCVSQMISDGKLEPESLRVVYADTRQELPPLQASVDQISRELARRGVDVEVCMPPMDKRFMVYILGRGVPPPNNTTLRWCTRQIKLDPMAALLADASPETLVLTGIRQGESAVRDGRIAMSCGINGGECGQGWYQEMLPGRGHATLAPVLHWRVCHVWDWLSYEAPALGWDTASLADAYGGDEARELETRTGCIGCPLASRDSALERIVENPRWSGLRPLLEVRSVYRWLRKPAQRLRKRGFERRRDGALSSYPQRMGPLTMEARLTALNRIIAIQGRCDPPVDLVNVDEEARIRELIEVGTWPNGWAGNEPVASEPLAEYLFPDGSRQPDLFPTS